uniref:U-box domain-containing protein n=1 Tax=Lutzomyia longipalpis TaxID=7200 RepID=A0A1B0CSK5_LUTLO
MTLNRVHEEAVHTLAFSPDSYVLVTGCNLGNLRFFIVEQPIESVKFIADCSVDNAHDLGVLSADFCKIVRNDPSDQRTAIYTLATCGTDHYLKIWRLFVVHGVYGDEERRTKLIPQTPQEHICGTSTIYCTERMNAECVLNINAHGSSVTCVRFNGTGTLLASCSLDRMVKIWDMQGNCLKTLSDHTRYVNCMTINGNSTIIASGSNDRSVIVWDLNGELSLNSHVSEMRSLLFRLVADSGSDMPLEFICPITHELMRNPVMLEDGFSYEEAAIDEWFKMGKGTSPMTNLELTSMETIPNTHLKSTSDQRTAIYTLATCGTDHYLKIWRLFVVHGVYGDEERRTKLIPQTPQEHICGTSTIYCTERMNAECVLNINAHGSSVTCVRFNGTGTLLASCSLDRMVKIWDMQGNCLKTLSDHTRYVNCMTINGNSTIIASGSNDRSVIVWDLNGELSLNSHVSEMRSLLFRLVADSGSDMPLEFICPITHELMRNPVMLEDGFSYEEAAIDEWFKMGKGTSPMTNLELTSMETIPNTYLKSCIDKYLKSLDYDAVDTGF